MGKDDDDHSRASAETSSFLWIGKRRERIDEDF